MFGVYTNIKSIQVSTLPLELRARARVNIKKIFVDDDADIGVMINNKRRELILGEWRNHTNNEVQISKDIQYLSISFDKIFRFGVRTPERRY